MDIEPYHHQDYKKNRSLTNKEIESDISKAYTSELKTITKIPQFSVFDKRTAYDNSEIKDYTLYAVISKRLIYYLIRNEI